MSWEPIGSETQAQDLARARKQVIRGAVIWTPVFAALAALAVALLVSALTGSSGAWFGFSLSALIALLSGSLALIHLRDLFEQPIETTGQIQRKWRKSDFLFFFPGHYVRIGKRVFRVRRDIYLEMPEPGGWIHVRHYPHSNALVAWHPISQDEGMAVEAEQEEAAVEAERGDWRAQQRRQAAEGERDDVPVPRFGRDEDE